MTEIQRHIGAHIRTIESLRGETETIQRIADMVLDCLRGGGCAFWIGNGGSAADCQHLAAELVGRFERERRGLASVALTTDSSVLTSVGNDYGFEYLFERQVQALCRSGDLLIAISTSGNSPNILKAVKAANTKGIATIGFSGRGGGALRKLARICLVVPDENTARIQEAHILVGHILCDLVERGINGAASSLSTNNIPCSTHPKQ